MSHRINMFPISGSDLNCKYVLCVSSSSLFMSMASEGEGSSSTPHIHTNRLAMERSPYLLQHAHNPVDW